MELVTIGTGTVAPSGRRTSAAHLVTRDDLCVLFDCGPGTLHRMAEFDLPWSRLTHVVISHFHPDHFAELPPLLFALKHTARPPRSEQLTIVGPVGLKDLVNRLALAFGPWVATPGFPVVLREIAPQAPMPLLDEVTLEAFPTPHTTESLAFSVLAPEGRLVYTGDTGPSAELAHWAAGCDLLLAECSLPEEMALDVHLTPEQAGELADAAGAKQLVLTHFYPPVELTDPAAAAATRFEGPVTAANDGDRFQIEAG